jgi:hypothetical protein
MAQAVEVHLGPNLTITARPNSGELPGHVDGPPRNRAVQRIGEDRGRRPTSLRRRGEPSPRLPCGPDCSGPCPASKRRGRHSKAVACACLIVAGLSGQPGLSRAPSPARTSSRNATVTLRTSFLPITGRRFRLILRRATVTYFGERPIRCRWASHTSNDSSIVSEPASTIPAVTSATSLAGARSAPVLLPSNVLVIPSYLPVFGFQPNETRSSIRRGVPRPPIPLRLVVGLCAAHGCPAGERDDRADSSSGAHMSGRLSPQPVAPGPRQGSTHIGESSKADL